MRTRREMRHAWLCHRGLYGGMAAILVLHVAITDHGGLVIPGLFVMMLGAFFLRGQHRSPKCPKWDDTKPSTAAPRPRRGRVRQWQGASRIPTSKIGINAVHAVHCWPVLVFGPCIAIVAVQFLVSEFFDFPVFDFLSPFLPFLVSFGPILVMPFIVGALLPNRHNSDICPKLHATNDAARQNRDPRESP